MMPAVFTFGGGAVTGAGIGKEEEETL